MHLAARDDMVAFEALVHRYRGTLVTYFAWVSGDRHLAEDAAQEVLVKLWSVRSRYRPESRFRGFLMTMARNHWIDRVRYRERRPDLAPESAEHLLRVPGTGDGPEEGARAGERLAALARSLASLSEEHRETFILSCVEGWPHADVAAALGVPEGTVKSRLHHAMKRLRVLLGNPEYLP
jgi:RNA polymerase sigma-70 factor (ECF subfamily)